MEGEKTSLTCTPNSKLDIGKLIALLGVFRCLDPRKLFETKLVDNSKVIEGLKGQLKKLSEDGEKLKKEAELANNRAQRTQLLPDKQRALLLLRKLKGIHDSIAKLNNNISNLEQLEMASQGIESNKEMLVAIKTGISTLQGQMKAVGSVEGAEGLAEQLADTLEQSRELQDAVSIPLHGGVYSSDDISGLDIDEQLRILSEDAGSYTFETSEIMAPLLPSDFPQIPIGIHEQIAASSSSSSPFYEIVETTTTTTRSTTKPSKKSTGKGSMRPSSMKPEDVFL
jgi:hypothetical protein